MARRNNHYEKAFEQTILKRGIDFSPINEGRVPIVDGQGIKNFDFLVYLPSGKHLLVELKGRKVSGPNAVNCWATNQGVSDLGRWRDALGEEFEPVFVFVFEIPMVHQGRSHFTFGDRCYQAWLLTLNDFEKYSHQRSKSWGTLNVKSADFREVARPFLKDVAQQDLVRA